MKCKVEYSPNVKFDLKEIKNWYSKFDIKLFSRFLKEYKSKIEFISEFPKSFEIKYNNYRIGFLKKFPFGIHYIYLESESKIIVYSVFHTSRNPEIWTDRK